MAHAVTGLFVAAPSTVAVAERFGVGVKVLTTPYVAPTGCFGPMPAVSGRYNLSPRGIRYMDNVPPEWDGMLGIDGDAGYEGPTSLAFAEGNGPYVNDTRPIRRIENMCFRTPGLKFITFHDPVSGVTARSNPIDVTAQAPAERLWWGDIHSQTFFSDGLRCPEELYAFAQHEAFLDVFAVSDHALALTDRQWDYFVGVTNDCYQPGRFATLVGLEWTSSKWGHRNAYFRGDGGPIWRANDPVLGELPNLYRAAREHGALLVPHHSANAQMGVDWSLGHDPEVERLVEIHSIWGNSERPASAGNPYPIRNHGGEKPGQHVIDALRRGYRFGFVGGGDIHDGRPGDELHHFQSQPVMYANLWRQGITGFWARDLTREAIFDALWNRRVYATTNARILLRFTVAGEPMGSRVTASGPVAVHTYAASEVPIAHAELVCNGQDVQTIEPGSCELDWDTVDEPTDGQGYYYVRITRTDGQMAWSSPVWVDR